jgi:hypothetical protein
MFDSEHVKDTIPNVKGGTVERLIDWLTYHDNTGLIFLETFLLCYPTFMSSSIFLSYLTDRYRSARITGLSEDVPTQQLKHIIRARFVS